MKPAGMSLRRPGMRRAVHRHPELLTEPHKSLQLQPAFRSPSRRSQPRRPARQAATAPSSASARPHALRRRLFQGDASRPVVRHEVDCRARISGPSASAAPVSILAKPEQVPAASMQPAPAALPSDDNASARCAAGHPLEHGPLVDCRPCSWETLIPFSERHSL